ncbi:MAG TPA: histidine kinase [Roseiflexaceae bacterium]|jgi:signal transduction histidine kinase|nr:histidine kinase [Roseiflexaceae bacterium]
MGAPAFSEVPVTVGLDSGLIATMRLVLSASVLFIISPSDLDPFLGAAQIVAALYTAYSAILFIFARRQILLQFARISYWVDVAWAASVVALSDDPGVAFLLIFPIVVASFQWHFLAALRLTIMAAGLLGGIDFIHASDGDDMQLVEIFLPPVYLLVFGYLIACWGSRESASRQRLVLLKEIARLSNPRFGIDRMIGMTMERLRAFYDADACLLIVTTANHEYLLRHADRADPERAFRIESIPAQSAQLLLSPPLQHAVIYRGAPPIGKQWWPTEAQYQVFDVYTGHQILGAPMLEEALVAAVDAASFISVPLRYPDDTTGRLYLTSARRGAFSSVDVNFLLQVIEQSIPMIENIRLVDQLASSAAEEERRRLARGIHDNVIQPYIGLQIGLAAVRQKLSAGKSDVTNDIAELMTMTDQGIADLRSYMHQLPSAGNRENVLLASMRRFIKTFIEATHIAVHVEATPDLYINDRLAAEVFQIVVEGLSNVRRHTHATQASVRLERQNDTLIVHIANDDAEGVTPAPFIPRSISERAAALGGQAHVERVVGGGTQVTVEIPL